MDFVFFMNHGFVFHKISKALRLPDNLCYNSNEDDDLKVTPAPPLVIDVSQHYSG